MLSIPTRQAIWFELRRGKSVADVARFFAVSTVTVYQIRKRMLGKPVLTAMLSVTHFALALGKTLHTRTTKRAYKPVTRSFEAWLNRPKPEAPHLAVRQESRIPAPSRAQLMAGR